MNRFDGTAARQLDLLDDRDRSLVTANKRPDVGPYLRVLQKDIYAELTRRRRRAQIAARHWWED